MNIYYIISYCISVFSKSEYLIYLAAGKAVI